MGDHGREVHAGISLDQDGEPPPGPETLMHALAGQRWPDCKMRRQLQAAARKNTVTVMLTVTET